MTRVNAGARRFREARRRSTLLRMERLPLKRLSPEALDAWLAGRIQPAWRVRAVRQWIYARGALDWNQMTDLPKSLRAELAAEASLCAVESVLATRSPADGSVKHLLRLADGELVEAVAMQGDRHPTFCISSQVGCPLDCVFCETGRMGFRRNLTQDEIVDQVLYLQKSLPPDSVRPPLRASRFQARPSRVSESIRITTSRPVSTRRLAFLSTISVMRVWFSGVLSLVLTTTSPSVARCMAVASSGRSSTSSTMR